MFSFLKGIQQKQDDDDKPPTLPDHLQMSIDLLTSMKSVVGLMVQDEESAAKAQIEIDPLQNELTNLLQACIEVDKENEKRHAEELESSKFVLDQVQQQLIQSKKEFSDLTVKFTNTKQQLADAEKILNNSDVKLLQGKVESLQQKLDNRDQRIESLVNQMEMKDREHELQFTRQKAKALLHAAPASDNERVNQLQEELEQVNQELDIARDDLEQATEDLMAADDKLKEADQAIATAAHVEDKLEQLQKSQASILKEKNNQLDNMETERETSQMLVEETRNILNEQAAELQEANTRIATLEKQVEATDKTDVGTLKELEEALEVTTGALQTKEEQLKSISDELRNTNEIMEIQAQVLKERETVALSSVHNPREIQAFQQKLEDAQDKIAYQEKQIKDQQQKIQAMIAGPTVGKNSERGNRSSVMFSPVSGASRRSVMMSPGRKSDSSRRSFLPPLSPHHDEERTNKLEKNVEKWKARALEDSSSDLQDQWRRIDELEEQLASANSSSINQEELKQKENDIADVKHQLAEAEAATRRIEEKMEQGLITKETEISSLDDQLERARQTEEELRRRLKEKDQEMDMLDDELEEARQTIGKLRSRDSDGLEQKNGEIQALKSKLESVQERAMSEEEYADLQKALLHANKSMKKGQKQINKLSKQLEEKDATIHQLQGELEMEEKSERLQNKQVDEEAQLTASALQKAQDQISSLRDELESKEKEVESIRKELKDSKIQSLEDTLSEKNKKIELLKDEIHDLKQTNTSLQNVTTKTLELASPITTNRRKLRGSNIKDLELHLQKLELDYDNHDEKKIIEMETYLNELKAKAYGDLSEELKALESLTQEAIQEKEMEAVKMKREMEKAQKIIKDLEKNIEKMKEAQQSKEPIRTVPNPDLEAELQVLKQKSEEDAKAMEAKETELVLLCNELATLKQATEEVVSTEESKGATDLLAEPTLQQKQHEMDAKNEELVKQERLVQTLQEERDQLETKFRELESTVKTQRDELETSKLTIASLEQKIESLGSSELSNLDQATEKADSRKLSPEESTGAADLLVEHILQQKQDELDAKSEQLEEKERLAQTLQDEIDQLEVTIRELESTVQTQRDELEASQSTSTSHEQKVESFGIDTPSEADYAELAKKDKRLKDLEAQLEQLELDLRSTVKDRDKQWNKKDDKIEELKEELLQMVKNLAVSGDLLEQKQEELDNASKAIQDLERELEEFKSRQLVKESQQKSPSETNEEADPISSLEKEIGIEEKDKMIKSLEKEIGVLSKTTSSTKQGDDEVAKLQSELEKSKEASKELKAQNEKNSTEITSLQENNTSLKDQLKKAEQKAENAHHRGEQAKRKSAKLEGTSKHLEAAKAKIKTLTEELETSRTRVKDLDEKLRKKHEKLKKVSREDGGKISDLEAKLEQARHGEELLNQKQGEIDVLAADLKQANECVRDLQSKSNRESNKLSRKSVAEVKRLSDLQADLEREMKSSAMPKKQIATLKASLDSKRHIIECQAYELADCRQRLENGNQMLEVARKKNRQLESEIQLQSYDLVALETKLDDAYLIAAYSKRAMDYGHFDPMQRDKSPMHSMRKDRNPMHHMDHPTKERFDNNDDSEMGDFTKPKASSRRSNHSLDRQASGPVYDDPGDDVSVNQYLDRFTKKMVSARKQLEAAQERINR